MTPDLLQSFFGWCIVINFAILLFSVAMLTAAGDWAARIHGKMFNVPPEQLGVIYLRWVAQFKLLVVFFNVVPWLALRFFLV